MENSILSGGNQVGDPFQDKIYRCNGNTINGNYITVHGHKNKIKGHHISVFGNENKIACVWSRIEGDRNWIDKGAHSMIIGHANRVMHGINILIEGCENSVIVGEGIYIDGDNNIATGSNLTEKGRNNQIFSTDIQRVRSIECAVQNDNFSIFQSTLNRTIANAGAELISSDLSIQNRLPIQSQSQLTGAQNQSAAAAIPLSCRNIKLEGKDEPAKYREEECVVCYVNKVCVVLGCGHLQLCIACAIQLTHDDKSECPTCKEKIESAIKVFYK